jgi:hypothetical protein
MSSKPPTATATVPVKRLAATVASPETINQRPRRRRFDGCWGCSGTGGVCWPTIGSDKVITAPASPGGSVSLGCRVTVGHGLPGIDIIRDNTGFSAARCRSILASSRCSASESLIVGAGPFCDGRGHLRVAVHGILPVGQLLKGLQSMKIEACTTVGFKLLRGELGRHGIRGTVPPCAPPSSGGSQVAGPWLR